MRLLESARNIVVLLAVLTAAGALLLIGGVYLVRPGTPPGYRTRSDLQCVSVALSMYARDHDGALPRLTRSGQVVHEPLASYITLAERQRMPTDEGVLIVDWWRTPIMITSTDRAVPVLMSAGPDTLPGSEDDITVDLTLLRKRRGE